MNQYNLIDKDVSEEGNNKKSVYDGDVEFIERFDGRGRKVKIKRGKIECPPLYKISYSAAVVNFKPETLITQ